MLDPTKTALFDVDGVCNRFAQPLLDAVCHVLRIHDENDVANQVPNEEDITTFNMEEHMPERAWEVACRLLNGPHIWPHLPVIEEAQIAVEKFRSYGMTVVFATSPWHSCEKWQSYRYAWLKKHFNTEPCHVMIGSPKELLSGAILFEDKAQKLIEWAALKGFGTENNGIPVLIDRPWNRGVALENGVGRTTWEEFLPRIDDLFGR